MPRLRRRPLLAGLTLLLAFTRSSRAQSPAAEKPSSPPAFRVDTGVVMLDVVVRDREVGWCATCGPRRCKSSKTVRSRK